MNAMRRIAASLLTVALADEPAVLRRDGGGIAPGFDAALDELRNIGANCDAFLLDLEARERARTNIPNLRVQYNKVHGFYIEVTGSHLEKVPADYQRRQTLKNAERFITPELKAFEDKALSAQDRALAREKLLYDQLLDQLQAHLTPLTALARALAALDALAALAERASDTSPLRRELLAIADEGRTPLVRLNRVTDGAKATVLAKIEGRNPAYSVKCRIGAAMIWDAEKRGVLGPGKELVEPTGGTTMSRSTARKASCEPATLIVVPRQT
mgnify:CR=1 FL=1